MKIYNNNRSPVSKIENFIWVAEYNKEDKYRRTYLPEFEFINGGFGHISHGFNEIDKDTLTHLGLIGNGYRFFFNTANGRFNLYGSEIEVTYYDEKSKTEYILMDEKNDIYNDIILYKKILEEIDVNRQKQIKCTLEYSLGYKKKIRNDFTIVPIFFIPMTVNRITGKNKPTYMTFKITSYKDLSGELRFYMNKQLATVFKTDLRAKFGKTFNINIS